MKVYIVAWLKDEWQFRDLPIKGFKYIEKAKDYIEDELGRPVIWETKSNFTRPAIGYFGDGPMPVIIEVNVEMI